MPEPTAPVTFNLDQQVRFYEAQLWELARTAPAHRPRHLGVSIARIHKTLDQLQAEQRRERDEASG